MGLAKNYLRRKRNYLINKDLQGRLGLKYLLITFVGTILLGLVFVASSSDNLTIRYDNNAIEVGNTPSILAQEFLQSGGLFLLVGGIFIIIVTIVLTHKIAGPLYRFEQTLKAMCGRNLAHKIHLRKGDEGQKLGSLINDFNRTLTEDITRLKETASKLDNTKEKDLIQEIIDRYQLTEESNKTD